MPVPRSRALARLVRPLFVLASVLFVAVPGWAQPTTTTARAGWRIGGTTSAMARLGNILYLGGGFRGVAPEGNGAGGLLVVDPTTGAPMPGLATIGGAVNAIEPDGAGGWFLGGNFLDVADGSNPIRFRLAHIMANGHLDPGWNPRADGGPVRALRLVPGVGLFVGGDFTSLSGVARQRVGLLDPVTGAVQPWTYDVAGGNNQVRTLAYDQGTLFIGGGFNTVNGLTRANLAAVSATVNNQVGPSLGVDQIVEVVAVEAPGTLYVGGSFSTLKGGGRLRLGKVTHAANTLDVALAPWNPGPNATVRAIAFFAGSVWVGGDFNSVAGQFRGNLAQLDPTTGNNRPMEFDVGGQVFGLAASASAIYVVGNLGTVEDPQGSSDEFLRAGAVAFSASNQVLPWDPGLAGAPNAVAVSGSQVGIGGSLSGFGALPLTFLAALDLDTGQVVPWVPEPNNGQIDDIVVRGSVVYVSGSFTSFDDGGPRNGLAALDTGFGFPLDWNPAPNGSVSGMTADDTYLYVTGNFTNIAGQPRTRIARFRLSDMTLDAAFQPSIVVAAGGTQPQELVIVGNTLYVGGGLITVNGGAPTRLAAIDVTSGTQIPGFAPNPSGIVNRMDYDSGFLYLAGPFTQVGGQPRQFVAKVDAATGALQPWTVPAIALDPDGVAAGFAVAVNDVDATGGTVIISGAFATIGGTTRLGVAQVDATVGALTSWAPDLGPAPGGFGGPIITAPDVTVIGGSRIQLPDNTLGGLALFIEPSGLRPLPPTDFTAEIAGTTLTLRWRIPPLGMTNTVFELQAGTAEGLSDIATVDLGAATSFTVPGVPPGTYYVRVRAITPLGASAATPDLAVTMGGVGCTSPPGKPLILFSEADADTVLAAWYAWAGTPTSFILEAGSAPGLRNLATVPLATTPIPVEFPGSPPGNYFLRVRSKNACGISPTSPEAMVNVGGVPRPPLPPLGLTGTAVGGTVTLTWAPPGFSTVTEYILEAGTTPGAKNIASIKVGGTTFSVGGVPSGVYHLRVRAVNAVGVSGPSTDFILVVQ